MSQNVFVLFHNKFVMEIFFLIALGYLTGVLAQKKGRKFITWFLIGLFTGGLGLLIVLILPRK